MTYLASDGLGSVSAALDAAGNLTAAQLFSPYGSVRYSTGTMPTAKGYTGQRADAASGLDYYTARYYDPVLGQFTSADTVLPGDGHDVWGLSRFAYVEGNPEGRTDPTGHRWAPLGDYFFAPYLLVTGFASGLVAAGQATVAARSVRAVGVVNRALRNKWKLSWPGNDPGDVIAGAADSPGTSAIKASARDSEALADAGEDLARSSKWLGRLGKVSTGLLFLGGALDAWSSYNTYEHDHPGDTTGAVVYAGFHAAATMAGGVVGAQVGAVAGAVLATAACGGVPVCGVVGYYAGSFVGGVVGSAVGGMIIDTFADVNNPTTTAVANVATSVASSIGSAWGSIFG